MIQELKAHTMMNFTGAFDMDIVERVLAGNLQLTPVQVSYSGALVVPHREESRMGTDDNHHDGVGQGPSKPPQPR